MTIFGHPEIGRQDVLRTSYYGWLLKVLTEFGPNSDQNFQSLIEEENIDKSINHLYTQKA